MEQGGKSLKGVSIFSGLDDARLEKLKQDCSWREFDPKAEIIGYLEDSSDVYFVIAGKVQARIYSQKGKVVALQEIGPGQSFGELAAIDGAPRSASVEALEHSTVAIMPAHLFQDVLLCEPTVAMALLVDVVGLVRKLTLRIYEYSTLLVPYRIRAELLRLAGGEGANGESAVIDPAPKVKLLAARISTNREAVSREISRLTELGILKREGNRLYVTNIKKLADMVHSALGE